MVGIALAPRVSPATREGGGGRPGPRRGAGPHWLCQRQTPKNPETGFDYFAAPLKNPPLVKNPRIDSSIFIGLIVLAVAMALLFWSGSAEGKGFSVGSGVQNGQSGHAPDPEKNREDQDE